MVGIISIPNGTTPAATRPHPDWIHPDLGQDEHFNFPVRTMLGDGLTWSLQIKLDMGPDPRSPVVRHITVPKPILDLFCCLPTVVGFGTRRDVLLLKRFFIILNPMNEVTMPAWIDLGTLAIAAGWSLRARGMTILGVQVTGITMNKLVSTGDDLWGAEWDRVWNLF